MPQFQPGESKVARLSIPVSPAGLSCTAELYLTVNGTTKAATSGQIAFTSTGAAQAIQLPIVMPAALNTYLVRVVVLYDDIQLGAYQAVDNVVVAVISVPLNYGAISFSIVNYDALSWMCSKITSCVITNPNSSPIAVNVTVHQLEMNGPDVGQDHAAPAISVTIPANGSFVFSRDSNQSPYYGPLLEVGGITWHLWLADNLGGTSSTYTFYT